ncbi:TPA: phosphoserine phosphatase, partial [Streptococcus pneumoniae]
MSQVKGLCVLDVDGTLILEEVIDLLRREAGHEAEISQITSRAM